jgi:hypothetical protein
MTRRECVLLFQDLLPAGEFSTPPQGPKSERSLPACPASFGWDEQTLRETFHPPLAVTSSVRVTRNLLIGTRENS